MCFHLAPFIAKSNEPIFFYIKKPYFLPLFGAKLENEIFPEKSDFVTFDHLWSPNLKLEKTNEPIPRKARYEPTNQRTNQRTGMNI